MHTIAGHNPTYANVLYPRFILNSFRPPHLYILTYLPQANMRETQIVIPYFYVGTGIIMGKFFK